MVTFYFLHVNPLTVISVAGHRLSTGGLEEVVAHNKAVAECAVIGVEDTLKVIAS